MESRRLVVVRHAKSAWPDGVPDAERPLNPRGRRDAPAAGRWIRDHVGRVDAVVCSPATRTRQTWARIAAELDGPPDAVFDERVYAATVDELLDVVRDLPADARTAVLIGHNPGVTELVAVLTGERPEMKTSSVAVLDLTGTWADAELGRAVLADHATPRG
ncbi:MAG TPA: histidine phosphatase family protein [Pseudonocardia sp.]|jgi:phosphohistidine phosphatase|uniref:SixA phosphatase family protein n=1 Tax=Pseudonocardia sp. TaxID=60912 RepID=UPI002B4B30FE|nr:histidine phosphatase family protein [Pseudonocardia sp.]HLU57916.1 histidine phosphatase family protein [Pseudonocardia sp.]